MTAESCRALGEAEGTNQGGCKWIIRFRKASWGWWYRVCLLLHSFSTGALILKNRPSFESNSLKAPTWAKNSHHIFFLWFCSYAKKMYGSHMGNFNDVVWCSWIFMTELTAESWASLIKFENKIIARFHTGTFPTQSMSPLNLMKM